MNKEQDWRIQDYDGFLNDRHFIHKNWVCKACFNEFKDKFSFKI